MRVSAGSLKNFDEWMQMYQASMSERVYENLDASRKTGAASPEILVIDGCSVDAKQLYREDKLGCARGVVWALIFEAGLVLAALIYWKLRLFAR